MTDHADLVRRLERLERSNRRWRRAGAGTLLAGLALLAGAWRHAPSPADTLEASRFVLVDGEGGQAGVLGLDDQGRPSLLLRKDGATAFLTLSGPGLLLRGDDGKRQAFLGFDTRGAAKLDLTSARMLDGVRLSVAPDGTAAMSVLGEKGRERLRAGYSPADGTASTVTRDAEGRVRSFLGVEDGDTPSLVLIDEHGARRVGMLVDPDEDGLPFVGLQDAEHRTRVELTTTFDGTPILALRRADGTPAFQAP